MEQVQITIPYNSLRICTQEFAKAAERLIGIRKRLEETRLGAIRDGLIVGKNADEREACARQLMKVLYEELDQAELDERMAKYRMDCAQIDVDEARALLRLEEAKAGRVHVHD